MKITEKPCIVLFPDLCFFKLQQKVWKFNDICMSESSQKTDMELNLELNIENRNSE